MEKTSTLVNNAYTNAKEYLHLKTRSVKLEVYDKVAGGVSGAVNGAVMAVLGLCAFIFLNVGLAYALSDAFDSTKLGFLALGGFYLVLLGIFFAMKATISTKIKNSIVVKMSKDTIADYEVMIKEKDSVNARLERAETVVKGNIEELKENIDVLAEDFKHLKEDVQRFRHLFTGGGETNHSHERKSTFGDMMHTNHNHNGEHQQNGGSKLPKLAVNTIVELLMNRFVLKDVNSIKNVILPIVAKAFITSTMLKGDGSPKDPGQKGGGILQTLKAKLANYL